MTQGYLFDDNAPRSMHIGKITFGPPAPPAAPMPVPAKRPEGQADAILHWLREGNSITPIQALNVFGCFRLGARIWGLKRRGWNIETNMITTASGKRVAEYRMGDGA